MSSDTELLIIPVEGILHVLHGDKPIDVPKTLAGMGAKGKPVTLNLHSGGQVTFFVDEVERVNPRAREVLADMSGIHIVLTGPVGFLGLEPEQVVGIVRMLS